MRIKETAKNHLTPAKKAALRTTRHLAEKQHAAAVNNETRKFVCSTYLLFASSLLARTLGGSAKEVYD